jgi:hypothetical protein
MTATSPTKPRDPRCAHCKCKLPRNGTCEECKKNAQHLLAVRQDRGSKGKESHPSGRDYRKYRVPRVSQALYEVALRVATGAGRPGDAKKVRAAFPGHELVLSARVLLIRWFWHKGGEWYE